jgi:hypothetical protein
VLAVTACVAFVSPITFLFEDLPARGSPAEAAEQHAVSLVPDEAPVSATNQLGGHLSERRYIFMFPAVRQARWMVVDLNDPTYHHQAVLARRARRFESDTTWRTVYSSHGIVVLKKR